MFTIQRQRGYVDARRNSIFIFDDIVWDKQNKITEYYSKCRHKCIDAAYFFQLPPSSLTKSLVCDNFDVIVLFE